LIVDDNEENRDVLARRLQRRGFDVTTADGGRAGVSQATGDQPDLILLDMNMPELDGWEAAGKIREAGITIPIVALTAYAMEGDRERAIDAGCTDYHPKPVEMETLLRLIERLLGTPAEASDP
jgi:CheY-like chemotaxis protein